jgi:hypothetical protein
MPRNRAVGAHQYREETLHFAEGSGGGAAEGAAISHRPLLELVFAQMLRGSAAAVSSLSAAIPYAASRRPVVPGSVTVLSRADLVPRKAATDLAKGRAWPDTEEDGGSTPPAPTISALSRDFVGLVCPTGEQDWWESRVQRRESS